MIYYLALSEGGRLMPVHVENSKHRVIINRYIKNGIQATIIFKNGRVWSSIDRRLIGKSYRLRSRKVYKKKYKYLKKHYADIK